MGAELLGSALQPQRSRDMGTTNQPTTGPSPQLTSTSLYRRYRPTSLRELIGQDHVVRALSNCTPANVKHAWLFSGPRGTGKTSTARVLAATLNCTSTAEDKPCRHCASCQSIAAGSSMDVVELDAASHSSVDDVRQLLSSAHLASMGNKRVFIIDEAHMLSKAAASALLKALEEPPSHVVWVLATTDPQAVLETIKSRAQHLVFKLVPPTVLFEHLAYVARDAGLDVSDDVIAQAVDSSGGSVRDALSALDMLVVTGPQDGPTSAQSMLEALHVADKQALLMLTASAVSSGTDTRDLARSLIAGLRELFLIQMGAPGLITTVGWPGRDELAAAIGPRRTVAAMELLGTALVAMRASTDPRVELEVCLMRCCQVSKPS